MKRIVVFFLLIVFAACSRDKQANMVVNITIKNLKKGTLYLQKMQDTLVVNVDSISLYGKETFNLYDNVASPEMYFLTFDANNTQKSISFFGEQGEIFIEDEVKKFGVQPVIKGSKNQLVLEEYQKIVRQFQNKRLDLIKANFEANQKKDSLAIDSIQKAAARLTRRQYLYASNFAITKKEFEVAPYIALTDLADANIHLLDTIYTSLSSQVKESLYGKKLETFINQIKKTENLPLP